MRLHAVKKQSFYFHSTETGVGFLVTFVRSSGPFKSAGNTVHNADLYNRAVFSQSQASTSDRGDNPWLLFRLIGSRAAT